MEKVKIRRTSSDYIGAINKTQYYNFNITSSEKKLCNDTAISNVNLYRQFLSERETSRNYRLILTINPYCTNVLFNPCTEISYVDNNGGLCSVTNEHTANCQNAIGKDAKLTPYDMVKNTEYSSEKHGFKYYPGLDIFNNHIIRNKSYRIVNNTKETHAGNFNTIEDWFRLQDGTILQKCCRLDINDVTKTPKHLYNADDVLSFENGDAINENLREENGWFGFYNTSTIDAKDNNGESLDISRVINNKGNCQFIDMYPDRNAFSLAPQYNTYKNRIEYNWDFALTYAFEHTVTHSIVKDGKQVVEDIHVIQSDGRNGLYIVDAKMVPTNSGGSAIMFRTLTKHNLRKGDSIHLFYNENSDTESETQWNLIDGNLIINNVGDQNNNNTDYYFNITNTSVLEQIFCTPKKGETYTSWDYIRDYFYKSFQIDDVPVLSDDVVYEVNQLVQYGNQLYVCYVKNETENDMYTNNIDKYFVRLDDACNKYDEANGLQNFPDESNSYIKVGNTYYTLYNHDRQESFIDVSHVMTANEFIMKIVNNAFRLEDDDNQQQTHDGPWNDYIAFRMVKVVNDIECNYYVRKLKKLPFDINQEIYKLAFANTIYGDDISQITFTDTVNTGGIVDNRGKELKEIFLTVVKSNRGNKEWYIDGDYNSDNVEVSRCFGPVFSGFDYFAKTDDNLEIRDKRKADYDIRYIINDNLNNELINFNGTQITIDDEWFYGDIVEYCPADDRETLLCDVNYRFNTMQREYGMDNYTMKYDEIVTDDYDSVFEVKTVTVPKFVKNEGYYYKPHYSIRLRGEGELQQGSHRTLFIAEAKPYQANGMFIKIKTNIKHNLLQGKKVIVSDTIHKYEWLLDVVYVIDAYTIAINKIQKSDPHYYDWITICTCINNGTFKVMAINEDIPSYANKVSYNTYFWRNSVGLWDGDEGVDLPFANNSHYIDSTINFYLKRQNYDRNNRLGNALNIDWLNDRQGLQTDTASNNEYIKDSNYIC